MLFYAFVNFFVGSLLLVAGLKIYRDGSDLIHEYHQRNVKDKEAYAKAFAKGLFVMSAGPFLCAVFALAGFINASVGVLLIGLAAGIAMIIAAQIKHNGGIF